MVGSSVVNLNGYTIQEPFFDQSPNISFYPTISAGLDFFQVKA